MQSLKRKRSDWPHSAGTMQLKEESATVTVVIGRCPADRFERVGIPQFGLPAGAIDALGQRPKAGIGRGRT